MSTIQSIHHINYVVKDLELSIEYFSKLLDQKPIYENLPQRDVKTARFTLGDVYIVLVEPLDTNSEVGQILKHRGEGLFLLSLAVDNLTEASESLEKRNFTMDNKGERQGLDTWRVCDIEQSVGLGPLLQICED